MISRLDAMTQGTLTLESYRYLGLSTVVERDMPTMKLTYLLQGMEVTGDAGDKYTGLDRFGRIVDQRWTTSGGTIFDRYQYTYDRDSNVLTKTNPLHTAFNENYTYNGLNQLIAIDRNNGTTDDQAWNLDALGNMTSVTTNSTIQTRTTNSDNQVTAISGGTTLAYDNNGNLTTDDHGDTLVYDAWNRLVEVKNSSGVLIEAYTYDGMGRRVTTTDGYTVTDSYYNTRGQVVEEKVGTGISAVNYWSAGYINALVYRASTGIGSYFATYDANYNVTSIGVSGTVTERFLYSPYGVRTTLNGSFSSTSESKNWTVSYQGMFWDGATGMFYDRARWYSPTLMRFVSQDPIQDGVNWYAADGDNPINRVDPTGLEGIAVPGGPSSFGGPGIISPFAPERPFLGSKEPSRCQYTEVYLKSNGLHCYLVLVEPDGTATGYRAGFVSVPWIVGLPLSSGYSGFKISGSPGAVSGTMVGSGIASLDVTKGGPASFGPVVAVSGKYGPGFEDFNENHDAVLVAVAKGKTDWSSKFDRVEAEINRERIPYLFILQNSNSYAYTLLQAIHQEKVDHLPGWAAPGWGPKLIGSAAVRVALLACDCNPS